ncbi:transcriptional regulator [Rhizobium lusitanum]|uniref:Transcriptional regulator n=1 Tax=Rhizobium lusitanum TaxID=293958 RepID=A0A6L9UFP2_9HYPH|nr:winged helix-turn-helix domain-containing protein [Rhizobium lusitanum]NEI74795.1 transcriptional regulator [Rhizobium lusitanum]
MTKDADLRKIITFGRFKLISSERLLLKDNSPVRLGDRALDALILLASNPNKRFSNKDLMDFIWPDVSVDGGSLRFQITKLRQALNDGQEGARFISNEPGRGYRFVAPVSVSHEKDGGRAASDSSTSTTPFLPTRLGRMIGRANDFIEVSSALTASHFVSIVGPGGVGKTTVAISVAHELVGFFPSSVLFVDLGMLSDEALVATSVASMLGIMVQSNDPTPSIIAHLKERKMLLVLDCCEHVIDSAAALAEQIFLSAPEVYILATSREPLRVKGENVYRIEPLAVPPEDGELTSEEALSFPAAQLFVERATATGARIEFTERNLRLIRSICRRLDGVALAIELAAGRVEAYGLEQIDALLDQRLARLWLGKRTASPRQKTLQATLNWSFELLSTPEKMVLRRLAIFVGPFTLEAAAAVVSSETVGDGAVLNAIDSLVAKSMVATRLVGTGMNYRLLDATRYYVLEKNFDDPELPALSTRYATYYRQWCSRVIDKWQFASAAIERITILSMLANVRAALEWCFGNDGDPAIGIELASSAATVFLAMSLLPECHRWSEQALRAIDEGSRGGKEEMHLKRALGQSLMFTKGNTEAAHVALQAGLNIAESSGDQLDQIKLVGSLFSFHLRTGDFKTALEYATRNSMVGKAVNDPTAIASGHSLCGISLHLMGDLHAAREELESAMLQGSHAKLKSTIYFGFDHINWAGGALARTLWLQGYPDQALSLARKTVLDATRMEHPITLSFVLNWAISVFLWAGDLTNAEEHISWMTDHANSHSLAPYLDLSRGFRGELALKQGDEDRGIQALQDSLKGLQAARYEVMTSGLRISLAEGLVAAGRASEAAALIDDAIRLVKERGDLTYLPEALRVRGRIRRLLSGSTEAVAESDFIRSLELTRLQGSRAWELRAATDLASLRLDQEQVGAARDILGPVFCQFDEGFDSTDVKNAANLLRRLA